MYDMVIICLALVLEMSIVQEKLVRSRRVVYMVHVAAYEANVFRVSLLLYF